ncbi:MAG: UDP-diphosphatase [Planctomyces sp.]|nr:UDP-diphosphatase [Planctomyces sp.]
MTAGELLEAVILGIVQGIAEFLPVSSSGHLVICSDLITHFTGKPFDPEASLQMNVALHAGTLLSIVLVYRYDLMRMALRPKSWWPVLIATAPLVLIALTPVKDMLEEISTPLVAGFCLLFTSVLLFLSSRFGNEQASETLEIENEVTPVKAAVIGLFQALALLPGISRSGSTITSALFMGVSRPIAAQFSFMIAIPAISGATVLMVKDYLEASESEQTAPLAVLAVGAIVSFGVGLFALKWLIRIVSRGKLHYFGWYCLVVGTLTILWKLYERFA